MPSYKKKDGTVVKFTKPVPRITQKMLGLRPARKIIKTSDIGKKGKKAGGMIKKPKKRTGAKLAVRPANSQPIVKKGTTSKKKAK
jgi:hypothetical protein